MTNINTEGLPPEMQARIADIIEKAKSNAIQPVGTQAPAVPPAAPIARPPSLMDHIIALRGEVAQLKQQVDANSNVVDAVGQAVGTLYQMFQPSAQTNAPGPQVSPGTTYSDAFSQSVEQDADY